MTDFGPHVLEAWQRLPWEGNTRQLQNLIRETLAHKERGNLVEMQDLPQRMLQTLASLPEQPAGQGSLDSQAQAALEQHLPLDKAVDAYERRLVQLALKQQGGNRTRAAKVLGLTIRTLFNKIKKHNLE